MAAAVVSQGFGKISGAFSRLGDELPSDSASAGSATPHNSQRRNQTSSSNLGGVGIVFSKDQSGNFVVRTLHEGSCAAASGICPGDVIVSVDGAGTQGMSMRQVASAISGAVGSQVTIKIRRGTQSGNVTLERMPGFSKGVVGRDVSLSSAAEDSRRSTNNQSALSSSRSALSSAAAIERCSPVSPHEPISHVTESSQNSLRHSLPASTMPSERDDEIMAIGSNSNVSFSIKDLARLPAAVASCSDGAARALDSRPTSMPANRSSKNFERSQLFLELKDPKAINAIVTQDCQHLIDSLASPDAFQGARQRLMSSRTRLPMADMKKIAYLGALKDIQQNPMFEGVCSRIPRNEVLAMPTQALLRPQSMSASQAYASISSTALNNSSSTLAFVSAFATVAKTELQTSLQPVPSTERTDEDMIPFREAVFGSLSDTGGVDFVDVVKHSAPMVGKTLIAGAGELAGTMKATVINTIMSDSQ